MPSFKMKAQSSTGCLREKKGLRVCQKSSVITKKACSHVRKSELTADLDTCKNCQEGKKPNVKKLMFDQSYSVEVKTV